METQLSKLAVPESELALQSAQCAVLLPGRVSSLLVSCVGIIPLSSVRQPKPAVQQSLRTFSASEPPRIPSLAPGSTQQTSDRRGLTNLASDKPGSAHTVFPSEFYDLPILHEPAKVAQHDPPPYAPLPRVHPRSLLQTIAQGDTPSWFHKFCQTVFQGAKGTRKNEGSSFTLSWCPFKTCCYDQLCKKLQLLVQHASTICMVPCAVLYH